MQKINLGHEHQLVILNNGAIKIFRASGDVVALPPCDARLLSDTLLKAPEMQTDQLNTILDQGLKIAELLDEVKQLTADLAALRASQSAIHLFAVSAGAEAVWQAWRDAMLAQGRDVPPERMAWETLPECDKQLDALVASGVVARYAKWMVSYAAEVSE